MNDINQYLKKCTPLRFYRLSLFLCAIVFAGLLLLGLIDGGELIYGVVFFVMTSFLIFLGYKDIKVIVYEFKIFPDRLEMHHLHPIFGFYKPTVVRRSEIEKMSVECSMLKNVQRTRFDIYLKSGEVIQRCIKCYMIDKEVAERVQPKFSEFMWEDEQLRSEVTIAYLIANYYGIELETDLIEADQVPADLSE